MKKIIRLSLVVFAIPIANASDEILHERKSVSCDVVDVLYDSQIDLGSITKNDLEIPLKPDFLIREYEEQGGIDSESQTSGDEIHQSIFKKDAKEATLVAVSTDLLYSKKEVTEDEQTITRACQFYAQSYVDKKLTDEKLDMEARCKLYFDEYTHILKAMGWIEMSQAVDSTVKKSRKLDSNAIGLMMAGACAVLSGGASIAFESFFDKLVTSDSSHDQRSTSIFKYLAKGKKITQRCCEVIKEDGTLYLDVVSFYFAADKVDLNTFSSLFGIGKMDLTQYVAHSRFILNMDEFNKNRRKIMDNIPQDQWMIYDLL